MANTTDIEFYPSEDKWEPDTTRVSPADSSKSLSDGVKSISLETYRANSPDASNTIKIQIAGNSDSERELNAARVRTLLKEAGFGDIETKSLGSNVTLVLDKVQTANPLVSVAHAMGSDINGPRGETTYKALGESVIADIEEHHLKTTGLSASKAGIVNITADTRSEAWLRDRGIHEQNVTTVDATIPRGPVASIKESTLLAEANGKTVAETITHVEMRDWGSQNKALEALQASGLKAHISTADGVAYLSVEGTADEVAKAFADKKLVTGAVAADIVAHAEAAHPEASKVNRSVAVESEWFKGTRMAGKQAEPTSGNNMGAAPELAAFGNAPAYAQTGELGAKPVMPESFSNNRARGSNVAAPQPMGSPVNNATASDQLATLNRLKKELQHNSLAVGEVAKLEQSTMMISAEEMKRGYDPLRAPRGYRIILETFRATDQELTAGQDARLARVAEVIGGLEADEQKFAFRTKSAQRSAETMKLYTDEKMAEFKRTGEVFLNSGNAEHFNVVRLKRYPDGEMTYTLYDSGHETKIVGSRIDEHGNERMQVNAMEERHLKPGVSVEEMVRAEMFKAVSSPDSPDYHANKAFITNSTEIEPKRVEVQDAQRRSNCTTRGQRLMMQDILSDDLLASRVQGYMQENTPSDLFRAVTAEADHIRANGARPKLPAMAEVQSWKPYESSAYGNSYRFDTGFEAPEKLPNGDLGKNTPSMNKFEEYMKTRGIDVSWGFRDGNAVAYVPESDQASFKYLEQHMRATNQGIDPAFDPDKTILKVGANAAAAPTPTLEGMLAEKQRAGGIESLTSNKGEITMLRGTPQELDYMQREFEKRGVQTIREAGTNDFGEGLRVRSNSTGAANAIIAAASPNAEAAVMWDKIARDMKAAAPAAAELGAAPQAREGAMTREPQMQQMQQQQQRQHIPSEQQIQMQQQQQAQQARQQPSQAGHGEGVQELRPTSQIKADTAPAPAMITPANDGPATIAPAANTAKVGAPSMVTPANGGAPIPAAPPAAANSNTAAPKVQTPPVAANNNTPTVTLTEASAAAGAAAAAATAAHTTGVPPEHLPPETSPERQPRTGILSGLAKTSAEVHAGRAGAALGAALSIKQIVDGMGEKDDPNHPKDGLTQATQAVGNGAAAVGVVQGGTNIALTVIKNEGALKAALGAAEGIAGKTGVVGAVAVGAMVTVHGIRTGNKEEVAEGVGGTAGALAGAEAGASAGAAVGGAVGAFFFGAGAAPGALIGGIVGGIGGGIAGSHFGKEAAIGVMFAYEHPREAMARIRDNAMAIAAASPVIGAPLLLADAALHTDAGKAVVREATHIAHEAHVAVDHALHTAATNVEQAAHRAKVATSQVVAVVSHAATDVAHKAEHAVTGAVHSAQQTVNKVEHAVTGAVHKAEAVVQHAAKAVFDAADANHDGKVSWMEAAKAAASGLAHAAVTVANAPGAVAAAAVHAVQGKHGNGTGR